MLVDFALMLSLAAGCGGTPMEQQVPVQRERGFARTLDTLGVEGIVLAPAAKVWEALPAVLTDLGLDLNFREPATRRVGTCYQKLRLRLAGDLLSTFVECGDSRGVPNADRYEVALTVLTTVMPTGANTSKVYTFVLGVGLDSSGALRDRLWCFSKGALEELIRSRVEERTRV